ncbi:MAG: ERCC4 domain-containing protein [Candidatus Thorarchaeota archaeon]
MQTDLFGNVPQIVIDVHETTGRGISSIKLLMQMLDQEGIHYAVESIPIADILGPDGVAIERKTVNDLVGTLMGSSQGVPRLDRQIDGLLEYERPYLLVENILSIRRDPIQGCIYVPFKTKRAGNRPYVVTLERVSHVRPAAFDALLQAIRDRGITVLEGFNAVHSAGILHGILCPREVEVSSQERTLPVIRTRKSAGTLREEQEFFVAGLPGINVVRARALLDEFGSPYDVITRTDDWIKIPGIGPKTVANARRVLFTGRNTDDSGRTQDDDPGSEADT